jgi:hypothetical protein
MKKIIMAAAVMTALAAGSVFAGQCTGDKGRRLGDKSVSTGGRRAQPPDPLISHKSPGRNKRGRRHHGRHRIHRAPKQ